MSVCLECKTEEYFQQNVQIYYFNTMEVDGVQR